MNDHNKRQDLAVRLIQSHQLGQPVHIAAHEFRSHGLRLAVFSLLVHLPQRAFDPLDLKLTAAAFAPFR